MYLDAAYSYAYYDSSLGDLTIELIETRRKLEELQSKFLQDTRPFIEELLETDLPRLERVLREKLKDLQATPAALLAAYGQARSRFPLRFGKSRRGGRSTHTSLFQFSPSTRFRPILKTCLPVTPPNERHSKPELRLTLTHRRRRSKLACLLRAWCACRAPGTRCAPRTKRTYSAR